MNLRLINDTLVNPEHEEPPATVDHVVHCLDWLLVAQHHQFRAKIGGIEENHEQAEQRPQEDQDFA